MPDNNDDRYPIFWLVAIALIGLFFGWCFFWVKGFAYDLEIGNYDFNGFDPNADFIFDDFLENKCDVYNNTEYENMTILLNMLRDNGYSDDYIEQFRIKVQTTVNENIELGTDNGATDAIVSDDFMVDPDPTPTPEPLPEHIFSEEIDNSLFTDEELNNLPEELRTMSKGLIAVVDNQKELQEQIEELNKVTSDQKELTDLSYQAQLDQIENENKTIFEKKLNEYSVKDTILLVLVSVSFIGAIVFLIFKFTPKIGR